MILRLLILLALATTALGQTYVISDATNLRVLDACGNVNSTTFVAASNLQALGSVVYYQAGTELYLLHPNGTSVEVCSGCLPPTSWVIDGSTVIGYGTTGITTQALGSTSSTNVYTPSGPNSVEGVAVAGSVVYWLENVPGGTAEIWVADYPSFANPTRDPISLVFEYAHMIKTGAVIFIYTDGQIASFEPRDTTQLPIRRLNPFTYPTGLTSAVLAPTSSGVAWAGDQGVLERFSNACFKNISSIPAQGFAAFPSPQECASAPCWVSPTTTTTTTSDAVRPSPWVAVFFCTILAIVLFL